MISLCHGPAGIPMYVVAMDKSTCKQLAFTDMRDIAAATSWDKDPQFRHTDTCSDKLLKDLEEQRRPGVVQIIRSGNGVGQSYGSGFFAGKDADTVVTNFHVVAGHKTLTVRTDTGEKFPAKVEKMDEANDLALLRVQGLKPGVKLNLPLAPEGAPMPSLEVTAIGHKLGKSWAGYSKGSLDSEKTLPYKDTWHLERGPTGPDADDATVKAFIARHPEHTDDVLKYLKSERKYGPVAIWHGDSGGPLMDSKLNVTGVSAAVSEEGVRAAFVPVDRVREFLKGADDNFAYRYEKKSDFDVRPSVVLAKDGALAALTVTLPRVGALVWGMQSAMQMAESGSVLSGDKMYGSKSKYILNAAEAGIGIGGMALSLFSKVRPVGFALMGVKAAWSIGGDFVKDKDVLMDVWRKDGGTREPLGWTTDKGF